MRMQTGKFPLTLRFWHEEDDIDPQDDAPTSPPGEASLWSEGLDDDGPEH